jgi:hypothetical protein
MRLGIVGSESAKFTAETEAKARQIIRNHISPGVHVVSGRCHLGGIDIWAVEEAVLKGNSFTEYPPASLHWEEYKKRNILIAENSDIVICITVKVLPPGYRIRGFEKYCYHCQTSEHIKSGGCWTVKYAKKLNKSGVIIVVE